MVTNAKLTEKQVKEIRLLLDKGLSCRVIGLKYGVDRTTIQNIRSGRRWGWVR